MRYIKTYQIYNEQLVHDPRLDKEVSDFVDRNKHSIPELWDDNLSEDDNIENMKKFFKEFPHEMRSHVKLDNLRTKISSRDLRNYSQNVQKNIGGTYNSQD